MTERPAVSVIVPLHGDRAYAERTRVAFARLERRPGDELIVADNTDDAVAAPVLGELATVVHAAGQHSSYFARNAGARLATAPWLLFVDADCDPEPGLLDAYFDPAPDPRCGLLAGLIAGADAQTALLARYTVSRRFYSDEPIVSGPSYAPTGNLLVRRDAFEEIGGFVERIRSAGDVDLCWRLQEAGWTLDHRPRARVAHAHREDLRSFLGMLARYGAGARWLNDRYPGSAPAWPLVPGLTGSARDIAAHLARGRLEPAAFRAIDGLGLVAHHVGYRSSNEIAGG